MINNEYPPLGGGTATINQLVLQELAKDRDIITDLITSSGTSASLEERIGDRSRIFRLPVKRNHIHHASNYELIRFAVSALQFGNTLLKKTKYDLIFAWASVPAGVVAYWLSYFYKIPYIVRVSGPDIPGFERRYRHIYPLLLPILKRVWKAARTNIVKCDAEEKLLRQSFASCSISLVRNGIDVSMFKEAPDQPSIPLRIVSVGRLIERKRHYLLMEAVQLLCQRGVEVRLNLIGDGDDRSKLEKIARSLNLEGKIVFSGYVPREDLPKILSHHHLYATCSEAEGMSVATLEALAAGLPILATASGGMEMLVRDGVNGYLLEESSPQLLADKIEYLTKHLSLLEVMGKESKKLSQIFSASQLAQDLKATCQRVL